MKTSSRDTSKRVANNMSHHCYEHEQSLKRVKRDRIDNLKKNKIINSIAEDKNDLKEVIVLLTSQVDVLKKLLVETCSNKKHVGENDISCKVIKGLNHLSRSKILP